MNQVIIAIGSNIEAEKNISLMLELLAKDIEVIRVSKMVKTKPLGIIDQVEFTNGAVLVETQWGIDKLKTYLKQLEDKLGRDRSSPKFGPRCMDLDILIFNNQIIDADYYSRDFLRESAKELGFGLY